jgi:DNA-binding NarL/FixJ family response regulator
VVSDDAHMAAHMSLAPMDTLDIQVMGAAPSSLNDLLVLASWLAVHWIELEAEARVALVGRIQRVASDLGWSAHADGDRPPEGENGAALDRLVMLTPREMQVLRALADGGSTSNIASTLGIGSATVRSHVKSLLAKLGVHSRVEAVSLILKADRLSADPSA